MMMWQVSKMEELSFRDILWHLVYARKLQNQLDIARYYICI